MPGKRHAATDRPRPLLAEARRLNDALLDLRLADLDDERGSSLGRRSGEQHSDPTGHQATRHLRRFDRYRKRVARLADEVEDLIKERPLQLDRMEGAAHGQQ